MCYHRKSTFLKLSEKFHLVAFSVGAVEPITAVVKVFLQIAIIIVKTSHIWLWIRLGVAAYLNLCVVYPRSRRFKRGVGTTCPCCG